MVQCQPEALDNSAADVDIAADIGAGTGAVAVAAAVEVAGVPSRDLSLVK